MLNNCRLINIVWIERGILLTLIYYIIKYYDKLLDRKIIVTISSYRKILRNLFPKLSFKQYTKHRSRNFYFNIRNIIRKQDIIIDYLGNNDYICSKKIDLIPWYDMNDILVAYKYDESNMIPTKEYSIFIKNFSMCTRSNYNNMIWDMWMEIEILKKYAIFFSINIHYLFNNINNYIRNNYTDTTNTYYVPVDVSSTDKLKEQHTFNFPIKVRSEGIVETYNGFKKEQSNINYKPIISIPDKQNSNIQDTLSQDIVVNNDDSMNKLITIINNIIQNIII